MDKKYIPIILMLAAGAVTCIITFIEKYSIVKQLLILLIVLLVFYFIGTVIKWVFISFEKNAENQGVPVEEEVAQEEEE